MKNYYYYMTIPRTMYDRLADAFDWDDSWFISFNPNGDTITFRVTEEQRKRYAQYAGAQENPSVPKKYRATYLITQIFWPKTIGKYCGV